MKDLCGSHSVIIFISAPVRLMATALVEQPQRQPHQRQVVSTKHLGEFEGHPALTVRMGSTRKTAPKAAVDSRKIGASAIPAHNSRCTK